MKKTKYLGIRRVSAIVEKLPFVKYYCRYFDAYGNEVDSFEKGTMEFKWNGLKYSLIRGKLL